MLAGPGLQRPLWGGFRRALDPGAADLPDRQAVAGAGASTPCHRLYVLSSSRPHDFR